ncbi:glycosyltransferase family 4 protein [Spongorhabdus nitratireducens]
MSHAKKLLLVINVDTYFLLHWTARASFAIQNGIEVHLATSITDKSNIEKIKSFGVILHPFPLVRRSINPFSELKSVNSIFRIMSTIKPDIIHTVTIKPNIYAGLIAKVYSLPKIATFPGLGFIFISNNKKSKILKKIILILIKLIYKDNKSKLLFENSDDAFFIKKHTSLSNQSIVITAGAGIDPNIFKPLANQKPAIPTILFASRIYENKGITVLISAVEKARKKGLRIKLLVAGAIDNDIASGNLSEDQLKKWQNEGKIEWLGNVKNMPTLMASATLICQPSLTREGLPRTILEAMACEKPVITTNVPGCKEAVIDGKTGLTVNPNSIPELEEAITYLLNNPETMKEMGIEGRRLILSKYSNDRVLNQTLEAYKSLLQVTA